MDKVEQFFDRNSVETGSFSRTLDDYLPRALTTWKPAEYDDPIDYLSCGFLSEIGEIATVYKRAMREFGGVTNPDSHLAELGDVLWYAVVLTHELKLHKWEPASGSALGGGRASSFLKYILTIEHYQSVALTCIERAIIEDNLPERLGIHPDQLLTEVCGYNIDKLADRAKRGVLKGTGDNR